MRIRPAAQPDTTPEARRSGGGPSLKARGRLLLLGFAVLPTLLLFAVLMHAYLDGARFRIENALDTVSKALAAEARGVLDRQVSLLELGGRHPWSSLAAEDARQRLALLAAGNPELRSLVAADADGRLLALMRDSLPPEVLRSRVGESIADRGYFNVALRERRGHVSEVLLGRLPGSEHIVALSAPILGTGGDVLGVLQATLDLDLLDRRLESSLQRFPHALVLDGSGQVVFASATLGYARGSQPQGIDADMRAALAAAESSMVELDLLGKPHFAIGAPVREGWLAVALLPRQTLNQVVGEAAKLGGGVLLATLVAAWFAARWGSAWITRPVHTLSQAIRGLQPDSSNMRLGVAPDLPRELQPIASELESLAQREHEAFARLDAALREREHEIERRTSALRRAVEALRDESRTDSLTGVGNYRAYRQWIEEGWREVAASGGLLGVLQVDIDHFKRFNDRYGHPKGDTCLRRIAELLTSEGQACRARVARTGGEEFTLICTRSERAELEALATRLVSAAAGLNLPHEDSPHHRVTLSVGIASESWRAGTSPEEVIAAADAALYTAKRSGRNRMQAAP